MKGCYQCKKIKHYWKNKQRLLKPLFISNRYFKNISVNFITSLSICKKNDKRYQHIIIIIDKLNKKKIYNIEFAKNENNSLSVYRINITKKNILYR